MMTKPVANSFLILYENQYKESRVMLVDASSYSECADIALARGLKCLGILSYKDAQKHSQQITQIQKGRKTQ